MAKSLYVRRDFKDDVDYQRIQILQNDYMISLLENIAIMNSNVINNVILQIPKGVFNEKMEEFYKPVEVKESELPSDKKAMISNLQKRKDEGEDINKIAEDLGLSQFIK